MPHVKMHFDGWVALPEAVRRRLHLATGSELEAELRDDGVLLRPAPTRTGRRQAAPRNEPAADEPKAASAGTAPEEAPAAAPRRRRAALKSGAVAEPPATPETRPARSRLKAALMPVPRTRGRKNGSLTSEAGHG
jgi:bifunctional DNA-binding transcriptional regulator/antitoxin component of YhaV-PrlF toxin-antitoxin module